MQAFATIHAGSLVDTALSLFVAFVLGAAIGALLVGLAEQFGLAYAPTYGIVFTFIMMVLVLAFPALSMHTALTGIDDAPRSIEVGEGLEVSVPFAPPSSAEVTVDAPEGITTRTEDGKLFVRAGYGMGDVTPIVVTVTEPGRAPSTTSVPLTVKHLAWTAHYSWKTGPSAREHGALMRRDSGEVLIHQGFTITKNEKGETVQGSNRKTRGSNP